MKNVSVHNTLIGFSTISRGVPEIVKAATVCSVHRKDSKTDSHIKWLVSLVYVACKILGNIVVQTIYGNANAQ